MSLAARILAILTACALLGTAGNALADLPTVILATDDVYDCALAPDHTWVSATSGGLVVGSRTITSVHGLPDTRVDRVLVSGDSFTVKTPRGAAVVSWPSLQVTKSSHRFPANDSARPIEFFNGGVVRARATFGDESCVATSAGLYATKGGVTAKVDRRASESLASPNVSTIAATPDTLYVGTFDSGLVRYKKDGEHSNVDVFNPNINALVWDAKRQVLWVGTARGLVRCDAHALCKRIGDSGGVHAIAVDKDGRVWAGGDGRLSRFSPGGTLEWSTTRKEGAPFRAVWSIYLDSEGSLYVGTTGGMYRLRSTVPSRDPAEWGRISMASGDLPDDWVTAIAGDHEHIYVGTYNAGIVAFQNDHGRLRRIGADPSLGYINPQGITALPNGEWAFATMTGLSIGNTENHRRIQTLGHDVTQVVSASDGSIWVSTRRGVMRLRNW